MTATAPIAETAELPAPLSDAELVDRFVTVGDRAAIAELVQRHSALIFGVIARVLRETCDIEDVFQATLLVLVRDAARVRRRQSVASWLHGVAYRLALRVARQKRRRRETMLVDELSHERNTLEEVSSRHDQQLVDAELNALPERYRIPIVMRYLSEKSPGEIADELQMSLGTLEGLLKRGKDRLRARLMRRGVSLGAAMAAVQLSQQAAQAACIQPMIDGTIQAGLTWHGGSTTASDIVSQRAFELAGKELMTMTTLTKSILIAGTTLGLLTFGFGAARMIGEPAAGQAEAGAVTALQSAVATTDAMVSAAIGQEPESKATTIATAATAAGSLAAPPAIVPKIWDRKARNDNVSRIEAALQNPTEVAFSENPLEEALNYLEDTHQIRIILDKAALQDEGVPLDSLVTLSISGVTLHSALSLMLEPLGLDRVIRNEVLTVTTRAKADATHEARVYDLSRLRLNEMTEQELDDIIRSTVAPGEWGSGVGDEGGTIRHAGRLLIVRHSQRVHEEIAELFNQLDSTSDSTTATGTTTHGR